MVDLTDVGLDLIEREAAAARKMLAWLHGQVGQVAAKRIQREIVAALHAAGAAVLELHAVGKGYPDLPVSYADRPRDSESWPGRP